MRPRTCRAAVMSRFSCYFPRLLIIVDLQRQCAAVYRCSCLRRANFFLHHGIPLHASLRGHAAACLAHGVKCCILLSDFCVSPTSASDAVPVNTGNAQIYFLPVGDGQRGNIHQKNSSSYKKRRPAKPDALSDRVSGVTDADSIDFEEIQKRHTYSQCTGRSPATKAPGHRECLAQRSADTTVGAEDEPCGQIHQKFLGRFGFAHANRSAEIGFAAAQHWRNSRGAACWAAQPSKAPGRQFSPGLRFSVWWLSGRHPAKPSSYRLAAGPSSVPVPRVRAKEGGPWVRQTF